jgi:hypothetical protein
MKRASEIRLNSAERKKLVCLSRKRSASVRAVLRAIVLRSADGWPNALIAHRLGIVSCWRRRYCQFRLQGILKDAPRGGRKPSVRLHSCR